MVCSGHSDTGVQMKTLDERVPDSVSGWIVNCTWSTWHRAITSVFIVSLFKKTVSVIDIDSSVFHFIYCTFLLLLSAMSYFSNMWKEGNKVKNKGECLLLKLLYMLSLCPKEILDVRKKRRGLPTKKKIWKIVWFFFFLIKHNKFPLQISHQELQPRACWARAQYAVSGALFCPTYTGMPSINMMPYWTWREDM